MGNHPEGRRVWPKGLIERVFHGHQGKYFTLKETLKNLWQGLLMLYQYLCFPPPPQLTFLLAWRWGHVTIWSRSMDGSDKVACVIHLRHGTCSFVCSLGCSIQICLGSSRGDGATRWKELMSLNDGLEQSPTHRLWK